MTKKLDYYFKATTPDNFEIGLDMSVEGKLMLMVFNKAKRKLARTKNLRVKGDPDSIQEFKAPQQYINVINTNIRPIISRISKEVASDGIVIMSWRTTDAKFIKDNDKWNIHVDIGGMYADKR